MDSNLPGWLVFALVTCIYADTYVVQYTTFEDLDMLSPWPVSHVGVVAKESNGSLWVIHNNGNGTYSMPWSEYQRGWNAHRVQVGDWKRAWNGSTVEGATQIGSRKYNLLFDNCYDARDSVVGYFSGALTIPPICIPNRTYCSHQLEARSLNTRRVQIIKKGLFQCREDGLGADAVSVCFDGCSTSWNNEAFCQCSSGATYCGHELYDQGDVRSYEANALYLCTDKGLNISYIETCVGRCAYTSGENSYCAGGCAPDRTYCGYQLRELGWKQYENNTLYLCEKDGKNVTILSACQGGCSSVPNAHCPCTIGSKYCGHELYSMGWTQLTSETDQGRLATCTKTNLVVWLANCKSCLSLEGASSHCMCTSGTRYCGHNLLEMGWEGYENNTLYLCEKDGKNVSILSACQGGCSSVPNAHCPCTIGSTYCGHELYSMGWTDLTFETDQAKLGRCTKTNYAIWVANCKSCLSQEGGSPVCMCTSGTTYCGHKLLEMGWKGYENNTLYLCSEQGTNVSVLSICEGPCGYHTCNCAPGKNYCGHELIGWRNVIPSKHNTLYRCTNGTHTSWIADCKSCLKREGSPYCVCKGNHRYCGHELDGTGKWYDNNTLYHCEDQTNEGYNATASYVKTCNTSCIRSSRSSFCGGECIPNTTYCGSRLNTIGRQGYNNDSLYLCLEDGRSVSDTGRIEPDCSRLCIPGHTYCGHEFQYKQHVVENDLHALSLCESGYSLRMIARCTTCISQESNSYCRCIPGWNYCGKWLTQTGYRGYDNHTVYSCTNEELPGVAIEVCPQGECRGEAQYGHCPCIPGKLYCGHEMYNKYNGMHTYLGPKSIYKCSLDRSRLIEQKACRDTCVSNPVRCQQMCTINRHYCGSDLLKLEGWNQNDLNPKILYQCTNGTDVLQLQNCTAGCQSGNGGNAYCLGMPTPWYWFFMGTTLPLLFVVLVGLLMRTIIKHRRLRAFVQQHRIDASQLALTRKLGCGQFGEVWMGNYKGVNGQQTDVALKISKHHLDTPSNLRLASADCFFQESVALNFLRHKNITRALGICSNLKDGNNKTTPALILEYMNGGNSIDYILAERGHLIGWDLKQILIDICQAGVHLHKMGVVHRDIGARNVLIGKNPQTRKPIVAKLTDFGLAKDIGNLTGLYKSTNPSRAMFHPGYTAPEGFTGEFSSQSDVWSFGVFMWEVYTLMDSNLRVNPTPYYDLSQNDILSKITNGHRLQKPALASSDTYAVMTDCWRWQTESRPTFDHLLKHLKRSEMDLLVVEDVVERVVVEEPVVEDAKHVVDYQEDPTSGYTTVAIVDYKAHGKYVTQDFLQK